ncbi:hypothetical protein HK096_009238 [Nowakowskiella sp. JEL0078]|nr:hypothetical protein HK096_009238 [Nowakowskiella sp. JEL0078]
MSQSTSSSNDEYAPTPMGYFGPESWSPAMSMAVSAIRNTLEVGKVSISRARLLTSNAASPYDILSILISQTSIPRRSDVLIDGMNQKDAEGACSAEWVVLRSENKKSDTNDVNEKIPVELAAGSESHEKLENEGVFDRIARTFTFSTTDSFAQAASPKPAVKPRIRNANIDERVILYFHGGAFIVCSPKTHRGITSELAKLSKARILAVDYRLSPESVYPSALHDCLSSYLFLIDPEKSLAVAGSKLSKFDEEIVKYNPSQVVVMGDSAGGNLVLALALYLRDNAKKIGYKMPAGFAAMSPWCDLTHSQPSFILNSPYDILPAPPVDSEYITKDRTQYYISNDKLWIENPYVSPLFANVVDINENISKSTVEDENDRKETFTIQSEENGEKLPLPPLLVQTGNLERLYHEILMFVGKSLEKSSGPVTLEIYQDMTHVHQMLKFEFLAQVALERLAKFTIEATESAGNILKTKPYFTLKESHHRRYSIISNKKPTISEVTSHSSFIHAKEETLTDILKIVKEGEVHLEKLQNAGRIGHDGDDAWVIQKMKRATVKKSQIDNQKRPYSTFPYSKASSSNTYESENSSNSNDVSTFPVGLSTSMTLNKSSLTTQTISLPYKNTIETISELKNIDKENSARENRWGNLVKDMTTAWTDASNQASKFFTTPNQSTLSPQEQASLDESLKAYRNST